MNNKKGTDTPMDPSGNQDDFINDTSGLTGITTSQEKNSSPNSSKSPIKTASNFRQEVDEKNAGSETGRDSLGNYDNVGAQLADAEISEDNKTFGDNFPPHIKGEQSISGSSPDPATDDDVLRMAQEMGIGMGEDDDYPKELDIAGDIDKSEEYHRTH